MDWLLTAALPWAAVGVMRTSCVRGRCSTKPFATVYKILLERQIYASRKKKINDTPAAWLSDD